MNQILFTETKKSNNMQDTKKIVLFFAITIIMFGLIVSGEGVYGIYKNSEKNNNNKIPNQESSIVLTQLEDSNIQISVESQTPISELIYSWNNDASQTISENGKTSINETISAPAGVNNLIVKIIDINGKQTTKQESFTSTVDKPEIVLSLVGDNIKITVESKTDLSYITYKWNSEEEQRIDMLTYEDKTKIEKELQIPKGTNTLKVEAFDINNNSSEKSQEIKGVTKPKSAPVIQGKYIYFEVTADEDIKQVEFSFNKEAFIIKEDTIKSSGNSRKVTYKLELQKGMNYLIIKTTTESGIVGEDVWKYEYKKNK